jgi:hypothetical protein
MEMITENYVFKKMWNEAAVPCFKVLPKHLPGGSEGCHKKLRVIAQSV